MPLMHGKSDKAFSHNVRVEMDAGKPQKQSLAIAYAMKRRAKKMAEGGQVHETLDYTEIKPGERKGISRAGVNVREAARQRSYGDPDSMARAKRAEGRAKEEHHAVLHDMKESAKKDRRNLAEGGFVDEEEASGYEPMPMADECYEDDMVDRIMRKRYSEGGRVANETPVTADFEDNEFDDLVKDDDLEGHYPGSQEIGDEQEDKDRRDIVSRIMRSRMKKDKMPRPA